MICPTFDNAQVFKNDFSPLNSLLELPDMNACDDVDVVNCYGGDDDANNLDEDDFGVNEDGYDDDVGDAGNGFAGAGVWVDDNGCFNDLSAAQLAENRMNLLTDKSFEASGFDCPDQLFKYFDQLIHRTWKGPEHWRVRQPASKDKPEGDKAAARKEKVTFEINFTAGEDDIDPDVLFEEADHSEIVLKGRSRSEEQHTLPPDLYNLTLSFRRLFTKPDYFIRPDGQLHVKATSTFTSAGLANINDGFEHDGGMLDGRNADGGDLPFNEGIGGIGGGDGPVHAFDEDYGGDFGGDGGCDSGDDVNSSDNEDYALDYGTQVLAHQRKTKPLALRYAKTAKRVDVKRLKRNIWEGIQTVFRKVGTM